MGGRIGTATDEKDGLMPMRMYQNNMTYPTTGYRMWQLYDSNSNYSCEGAVIDVLGIGASGQITISTYNAEGTLRYYISVTGGYSPLKLLEKDKKVFLYSNQRGNYSKVFIKSTMSITLAYYNDETPADISGYNEIDLEQ